MPAPRRTLVKVCGLTSLDDARAAEASGADWLGYILKGESPRLITPEAAAAITSQIPAAVHVAVMVGVSPAEALDLARRAGASRVQLHRVDPATWPAAFPLPVAFAVSVDGAGVFRAALPAAGPLVLLDRAHATLDGGTGETFPWDSVVTLARERDIMLAGGLGPDNVGEAIARVRPFGVDASSRLEDRPGHKDHERVRRYVAAVRECDERSDVRA